MQNKLKLILLLLLSACSDFDFSNNLICRFNDNDLLINLKTYSNKAKLIMNNTKYTLKKEKEDFTTIQYKYKNIKLEIITTINNKAHEYNIYINNKKGYCDSPYYNTFIDYKKLNKNQKCIYELNKYIDKMYTCSNKKYVYLIKTTDIITKENNKTNINRTWTPILIKEKESKEIFKNYDCVKTEINKNPCKTLKQLKDYIKSNEIKLYTIINN